MTTGEEESFKEWVKKVALLGEKVGNWNRKDWVRREQAGRVTQRIWGDN